MSKLHQIDKPNGKYTKKQLDEFMVFCILDTAVPYEMVCKTFNHLRKQKMTTREGLRPWTDYMVEKALRDSGYRFPKQHAKRLKDFSYSDINLRKASRKEMVENINGIGMKLASMFLRNTRGYKYAVLDVHTLRWLKENYKFSDDEFKRMSYEKKEKYFLEAAEFLGRDPMELDLEIWNERRVGNR